MKLIFIRIFQLAKFFGALVFHRLARGARCCSFWAAGTLLLFCPAMQAQIQSPPPPPPLPIVDDKPINVDTLLFTIPLTVKDSRGKSYAGLKRGDFKIYQDGEEQDVELFLNEEAPMNVAILLDTSRSTGRILDDIQKAARDFVKLLRKEDRAIIAGFDNQTRFYCALTSNQKILAKAIGQAQISNAAGSDMYLAIDSLLKNTFAAVEGRKAVIVLTDGVVSGSRITVQQTLDNLQKFDTIFYPIIFKTDFYQSKTPTRTNSSLIRLLQILAEETNGTFYEKESTKLKETFSSIAIDLKNQYLLGFYPEKTTGNGTDGYIKVELKQKGLYVRAKKKLKL